MAAQRKKRQPGRQMLYGFLMGLFIGAFVTGIVAFALFRTGRITTAAAVATVARLPATIDANVTPSVTLTIAPSGTRTLTPIPPSATPVTPTETLITPSATLIPATLTPLSSPTLDLEPLRFTGTGDRVFDPMPIPDGVYRVTFSGSDTASLNFTEISGDCGYFSAYVYSDDPIDESSARFRDCTLVLSINASAAWELVFELLAS